MYIRSPFPPSIQPRFFLFRYLTRSFAFASLLPVRSRSLKPHSAAINVPRPVKFSTYCAPIVPQELQGPETPRSDRILPSAAIGRPKA
ncbi:hypothetical protein GW17_00049988 [Ensete ventricosum]|nr:hypothetical protein GW17_00049988 [Ensete ventricosum]